MLEVGYHRVERCNCRYSSVWKCRKRNQNRSTLAVNKSNIKVFAYQMMDVVSTNFLIDYVLILYNQKNWSTKKNELAGF